MAEALVYPGSHAQSAGNRTALIEFPSMRSMTYRDLDGGANRIARVLRSMGAAVGDHVSFWCDNDLEYPMYWWGAHYAGLYYTPISTRLTLDEAMYIVRDAGSRVLVVSARIAAAMGDALSAAVPPDTALVVTGDDPGGLTSLMLQQSAEPLEDGAPAGSPMLYSSGTTGVPKGVRRPLSGDPLGAPTPLVALAQFLFGIGPDSVYLSPAPLYHAAPFGYVTAATSLGATVVILERFDAEVVLEAIEQLGVTHAQFVPTMFIRLLRLPAEVREKTDVSSLQCVIHAAAPCPIEVKEQMMAWWGPILHEYYSGTEGVGFTYCSPTDWLEHKGSVGRAMLGVLHIVDEDGRELPPGEEGLVTFSDSPPFEYHNDAAKTEEAYVADGLVTLGDVGRVVDGFLYLTDRRSDLIIRGGVNVYPQEAENVLAAHPMVDDVAVIGVPHEDLGEEVVAIVRPAEGTAPDEDTAAALLAHCRERLADVKCPRTVEFRDELPREPNGKLLKRKLRDEYWGSTTRRI